MRGYELSTISGFTKSNWLLNRAEQLRFHAIAVAWKKANKNATEERVMLFESLLRVHIFEQRLCNNSMTFFGDKTVTQYVKEDRSLAVDSEDMAKKRAEFGAHWYPMMKIKIELLKLSLANSINLDIGTDVSSLFHALDKSNNGSSNKERNSDSRTDRTIV